MAIFAVTIISLIGFTNHDAFATSITANQNGNWDDTNTWVGGVVPSSTDAVTIPNGVTVTIESGLTVTVDSTGSITNSGTIANSGTINNAGTISGSGLFTSSLQSITNTGDITDSVTIPDTTISSNYILNFFVTVPPTVTLTINSGITLALEPTGYAGGNIAISPTGSVNNLGTINLNNPQGDIENSGTITNSGLITRTFGGINNSGTISGTGTIQTSFEYIENTGTITDPVTIPNTTLSFDPILNFPIIIPSGVTLTIPSSFTFTIDSGTTVTVNSGGRISNLGIIINNGIITNLGNFDTLAGGITTNYNTIINKNPGIIYLATGASFTNQGSSSYVENFNIIMNLGTLTNSGTINIYNSGFLSIQDGGTLSNSGIINNNNGLCLCSVDPITVTGPSSYSGSFTNTGTFNMNPGSRLTIEGTGLTINPGVTWTIPTGVTLAIQTGATLTISGTVENSGTIINDDTISGSGVFKSAMTSISNTGGIYPSVTIPSSTVSADYTLNFSIIVPSTVTLTINPGVTLSLNAGGQIKNQGIVNIQPSGKIQLDNIVASPGTLGSANIINTGTVENLGTIYNTDNNGGGIIINNLAGIINNHFTIFNKGTITNSGVLNNFCGATFTNLGTFTGNSIVFNCPPITSVPSTTGAGAVSFSTSAGGFSGLTGVSQSSLSPPPPSGVYPLGFFSWSIGGFAPATSVTVTITSPIPLDPGTNYVKLIGGSWVAVPVIISGNTITLTIADNGPYDGDSTTGVISDPGTPIVPTNGKVTGGGQIGTSTDFAFEVKSDIAKHTTKGNLKYNDKSAKLNLQSNGISLLSIDPSMTKGTFVGKGNIGKTNSDVTFLVSLIDPDKKGNHDKFSITITDNSGKVIYQNTGTVKGHIEIHKFADRNDKSDSG